MADEEGEQVLILACSCVILSSVLLLSRRKRGVIPSGCMVTSKNATYMETITFQPKGVAHATPGQFLGFFSGIHVGIPKFQFVVKRICKFSFEKCITVVCSMFASIVSPITWSEPSFLLDAALLHCWAVATYTGILGLVVRPSMLAYIAKRPTMNTVFYLYR